MGMAASQARFLSLTGRKSNTEYQGQQVNQQRTALANQSANLYSEMTNLTVPTPPVQTDFFHTVYTLTDMNNNSVEITDISKNNDDNTNGEDGYGFKFNLSYQKPYSKITSNSAIMTSYDSTNKILSIDGLSSQQFNVTPVSDDNEDLDGNLIEIYNNNHGTDYTKSSFSYVSPTDSKSTKGYYVLTDDLNKTNGSSIDLISVSTAYTEQEAKDVLGNFSSNSATGRYTSITLDENNEAGLKGEYVISYSSVLDEDAYDQAYQEYEFKKDVYEKTIQELNAKTESIQQKDKTLELKLKQLDTEQDALAKELEAVQKVIQDNVEKTFNTFA